MKLTRKQIKEGLDQIPMEAVLLGAANKGEVSLSPKDIEFARQLAMGEKKAAAYRKSRPGSRAKPVTQSRRGQELAKKSAVAAQVEAFRAAIEAQKYATPQHLRALVITELTKAAINEDFPPATRVNALKLLGTITEVAAFTERREVRQVSDSAALKEKLLASLRMAMTSGAEDVDADSLLSEIAGGKAETIDAEPSPPAPHHPNVSSSEATPMHSNSHIRSPEKSGTHPPSKMGPIPDEDIAGEPPLVDLGPLEEGEVDSNMTR